MHTDHAGHFEVEASKTLLPLSLKDRLHANAERDHDSKSKDA